MNETGVLTGLMGGEMTVRSTPAAASSPGDAAATAGTVFRIRLFLPEVHGARLAPEPPRRVRTGYAGARRRVLVVDNEEVERELLVSVLQPLGFELHTVASGHECLAWLAARGAEGHGPDAILMDLAMPGIDGWATVRAIRTQALSDAPIAIVSGNAFDKGLDNDVGISIEDFILKPVRVAELLDWFATRLRLTWTEAEANAQPPPVLMQRLDGAPPDAAQLRALDELVNLGYYRGIVRKLDEIEAGDSAQAGFVTHLRDLARQFQLDAMTRLIRQALREQAGAP